MKIGISGHQNIRPVSSIKWVESTIRRELRNSQASTGISSLSAGTDQIFAAIVLDLQMELEVVIPCKAYESTFTDLDTQHRYESLKAKARHCDCLDFSKPSEQAFLRAGQRVVELCDMMFFVWNGKPSLGLGGTADIVDYARTEHVPFVWLNPSECSLKTSE